jgi:apolipoprotein N-acyltransferase
MGNAFRYATALIVGLVFYVAVLQWLRVADDRMVIAWLLLATYCALYFPLAIFLIRCIDLRTRVPLLLSVPVVWTALEFLRSNFGTGFGWYLLGYSQHDNLPLIQIADITGVYGVSFILAACNALVAEYLFASGWLRGVFSPAEVLPRYGVRGMLAQTFGLSAALLAVLVYGYDQLADVSFESGPRIALVQGNLDQRIRNDAGSAEDVQVHYERLSMLAGMQKPSPEIVIWPETSYPFAWMVDRDGKVSGVNLRDAQRLTGEVTSNILLGTNVVQEQDDLHLVRYNAAVLLTSDGKPAARYDKIHRVPFGEYVPLRDWIPLMSKLAPYDFDYSVQPGTGPTRFSMQQADGHRRPFTFGVMICFEDTDPVMARPYGGDGGSATDFLVNISNDGWFLGTSEHDEHLAICRFRAIETRRAVARAVNMGISAVIDANGRVLKPELRFIARPPEGVAMTEAERPRVWDVTPIDCKVAELPVSEWHQFKRVQGVLSATIPLDHRGSLYARWGDWLAWACWVGVALGMIWGTVKRSAARRG